METLKEWIGALGPDAPLDRYRPLFAEAFESSHLTCGHIVDALSTVKKGKSFCARNILRRASQLRLGMPWDTYEDAHACMGLYLHAGAYVEVQAHAIMQIVVDALNDSFKWFRFHVESTPDCLMDILPDCTTFMYLQADQWRPLLYACWADKALYEEDFCFFLEKEKQTGLYIKALAYRVVRNRLKWPITAETQEQYAQRTGSTAAVRRATGVRKLFACWVPFFRK
jgi:hypothetical protein